MTTKVFTPDEVAEILKIKEGTVLEYLRKGRLKGIKMGGKVWRVTEAQIEDFLQQELTSMGAASKPGPKKKAEASK